MKNSWNCLKLEDCFISIKNGANIKQEKGAGGIPITRIETLSGGIFNRERLGYANIHNAQDYSSYILEDGDLLFSHINSKTFIGRTVLYEKRDDETIIHGMNLLRLKVIPNIILPRFVYYAFKSDSFKKQIITHRKDAVNQSSISVTDLKKITIPVPPLNEQLSIVNEFDLLNGIIQKKNEQLKILDKLAESTFYEMFGVPAESTDTKYPIIDYANCIAGATPSTLVNSYWENGTIPWLSSGEVAKGRISETDTKITQEGYDSCSTRLVPKDSVLVAMAGQGKTRGTVGITNIELCTNQSICSIVINKDSLLPTFLYYQLKYLYNELRSISNGDGGRGGLNLKLIGQFKIMIPQKEKQSLFVDKAVFIEKEKLLIKESIKPLEQLLAKRMDKYFNN